jgi:hypothetical protein
VVAVLCLSTVVPIQATNYSVGDTGDGLQPQIFTEYEQEQKSEARQNYEALLTGGYYNGELIQKFEELFGDLSPEYILENYEAIFDVEAGEIDEGFLAVVTSKEMRGYQDSQIATQTANVMNRAVITSDSDDDLYEELFGPIPEPELPEYEEAEAPAPSAVTSGAISGSFETGGSFGNSGISTMSANSFTSITYSSKTSTSVTFTIWYVNSSNQNNLLRMYNSGTQTWSYLLGQGQPAATNRSYTATGLNPGGVYTFRTGAWDSANQVWYYDEITVQTTGAQTPSITVTSTGTTSMTVNIVFPSEGSWGNRLEYYHWLTATWSDAIGSGYYSNSGTYTISGLTPGERYRLYFRYYDHMNAVWPAETSITYTDVRLPLPAEVLQTYSKSNMTFSLDTCFTNIMNLSSGRLDAFLTKTNTAYDKMYELVGGAKPFNGAKMQLQSTRDMDINYEGLSGQPILWNTTGLYFGSPSHALRMNQLNADLTEIPLHEMGHNFDSYTWLFEPEALAIFKIYYYFSETNEKMVVASQSQSFTGGSGFKTYMKSYANRLVGEINYDAAMSQGVYSPYSLAYRLACIADTIGWDPFKKTFRYFNRLTYDRLPATYIDKFNLFMTKLRDYDPYHQDVIGMFTSAEKTIFKSALTSDASKSIKYVDRAIIVIPGAMGSRLNYNGSRVWEPTAGNILDSSDILPCDETGASVNAITVVNDGKGTLDTYEDMFNALTAEFEPRYDVVFFPYDWRFTNAKTGLNVERLTTLANGYDEVYIVAHSMGGILASSYAANSSGNRAKVHKLITIGTPYLGSAKAIAAFETGALFGFPLDFLLAGEFRLLSPNFASAYELLPNSRYTSFTVINDLTSGNEYTYSGAINFLKGRSWAKDASGAVKPFFTQASNVHSGMTVSGNHVASIVPHSYIVGTGESTPKTAVYDYTNINSGTSISLSYFLNSASGDGTVLSESARNGALDSIISINYVDHMDLMSNYSVISHVKAIINEVELSALQTQSVQQGFSQGWDLTNGQTSIDERNVSVVIESACNTEITDSDGSAVIEDGEKLYVEDISGSKHSVGAIWQINYETNRKQYVFRSGQYSIKLSNLGTYDGVTNITVICQDGDIVQSSEVYDNFTVTNEAVISVEPDSATVFVNVPEESSGDMQAVLITPSRTLYPQE